MEWKVCAKPYEEYMVSNDCQVVRIKTGATINRHNSTALVVLRNSETGQLDHKNPYELALEANGFPKPEGYRAVLKEGLEETLDNLTYEKIDKLDITKEQLLDLAIRYTVKEVAGK